MKYSIVTAVAVRLSTVSVQVTTDLVPVETVEIKPLALAHSAPAVAAPRYRYNKQLPLYLQYLHRYPGLYLHSLHRWSTQLAHQNIPSTTQRVSVASSSTQYSEQGA